jgi:hypothetical protein
MYLQLSDKAPKKKRMPFYLVKDKEQVYQPDEDDLAGYEDEVDDDYEDLDDSFIVPDDEIEYESGEDSAFRCQEKRLQFPPPSCQQSLPARRSSRTILRTNRTASESTPLWRTKKWHRVRESGGVSHVALHLRPDSALKGPGGRHAGNAIARSEPDQRRHAGTIRSMYHLELWRRKR